MQNTRQQCKFKLLVDHYEADPSCLTLSAMMLGGLNSFSYGDGDEASGLADSESHSPDHARNSAGDNDGDDDADATVFACVADDAAAAAAEEEEDA